MKKAIRKETLYVDPYDFIFKFGYFSFMYPKCFLNIEKP